MRRVSLKQPKFIFSTGRRGYYDGEFETNRWIPSMGWMRMIKLSVDDGGGGDGGSLFFHCTVLVRVFSFFPSFFLSFFLSCDVRLFDNSFPSSALFDFNVCLISFNN